MKCFAPLQSSQIRNSVIMGWRNFYTTHRDTANPEGYQHRLPYRHKWFFQESLATCGRREALHWCLWWPIYHEDNGGQCIALHWCPGPPNLSPALALWPSSHIRSHYHRLSLHIAPSPVNLQPAAYWCVLGPGYCLCIANGSGEREVKLMALCSWGWVSIKEKKLWLGLIVGSLA